MPQIKINYKDEILKELSDISAEKAKQVLEFLCFIKHKEALDRIDPTQLYFFTPKWQRLEKEAEADLCAGRVSKTYSASEMDDFFSDLKKAKK